MEKLHFALMLAILPGMALAQSPSNFGLEAGVVVASANYEPAPALPGQYLTLWAHVQNNSNSAVQGVVFNLKLAREGDTDYPFYLEPGDSSTRQLGSLAAHQSALVSYKVLVDPGALDGSYTLYLETGSNGKIDRGTAFKVSVFSRKPVLKVVNSQPTEAFSGDSVRLLLTVKNIGSSPASNVSIGVAEDRTVTTSGVVVERDIVPLGAAYQGIGSLSVGAEQAVQLDLVVNPGASPKAYFVPVTLEFYDENRTKYSETSYVGLKVSDKPDLGISATNGSKPLEAGVAGEAGVEIYNTGSGAAKFLVARVESRDFEVLQREYFIGSLEPDDFDSLSVRLKAPEGITAGEYGFTLTLEYKDGFGNRKTQVQQVPVRVGEKAQGDSGLFSLPVLGVAALVAAALAWLKMRR